MNNRNVKSSSSKRKAVESNSEDPSKYKSRRGSRSKVGTISRVAENEFQDPYSFYDGKAPDILTINQTAGVSGFLNEKSLPNLDNLQTRDNIQSESLNDAPQQLTDLEAIPIQSVVFYNCRLVLDRGDATKKLDITTKNGNGEWSFSFIKYKISGVRAIFDVEDTSTEERSMILCQPLNDKNGQFLKMLKDGKSTICECSRATVELDVTCKIRVLPHYDPKKVRVSFLRETSPSQNLEYICSIDELTKNNSDVLIVTNDFVVSTIDDLDKTKIVNYLKSLKEKKEPAAEKSDNKDINDLAIQAAFDTPFHTSGALKEFETYVIDCYKKWVTPVDNQNLLAPIGSIVQSCGHGKTRTMAEFAKKHITVFMCLRKHEDGYPKRSELSDLFESCLKNLELANKFFVALIKTVHSVISQLNTTNEVKAAEEFFEYQSWRNDSNEKSKSFVKKVEQFLNIETASKLSNYLVTAREETRTIINQLPNQRIFIFIDEARYLVEEFTEGTGIVKFCIMRRAIRNLFVQIKIAVILADTQRQLSHFVHSGSDLVTSDRNKFYLYKPFCEILYVNSIKAVPEDSAKDGALVRNYNAFMKTNRIDYGYLLNIKPRHTSFLLGRPLWVTLAVSGYNGLEQLAVMKLLNTETNTWPSVHEQYRLYSALAIICSRTTMSLSSKLKVGTELVARHMSTLYWMSQDCEEIAFRYIQEPILANAAAILMTNHDHLADMLEHVHNSLAVMSLDYSGAIGEVVTELILLLAFDKAVTEQQAKAQESKRDDYSLKPVTIEQFLKVLFGEQHFDQMNIEQNTKEALLYFNHFVKVFDDLSEADVHKLFKSCAGVQINNSRFDLVLFAMRRDDTIVALRFQIKNVEQHREDQVLLSIGPNSFQRSRHPTKVVPYISILMNLGHSTPKTIFEAAPVTTCIQNKKTHPIPEFEGLSSNTIRHYQANGFNSSVYPFIRNEKLVNAINNLINLNRLSKKSLDNTFGELVVEQVFGSSLTTRKPDSIEPSY